MDTTELAIATDFCGESARLEDIEELFAHISAAGITHIHWCHEWDGDYTYSKYEMEQIREWMDKYHLKAKALHATKGSLRDTAFQRGHYRRDFTSDWECCRKAGVELIQNRIDLAHCLGATEIVLHLHMPVISFREGKLTKEDFYANVKKSFDELRSYCRKKNIRICVENLFDSPGDDVKEQWDWIRENYSADYIGYCLDIGHANIMWGAEAPKIIEDYAERIYAVHLHDNFGGVDYHMLPGMGEICWEEVMRVLAKSPYELPLTFELTGRFENLDEYLKRACECGKYLGEIYRKYR